MINYFTENIAMPKLSRRAVNAWLRAVADNYGKRITDVAYIFCDNKKILEVNRKYLQHDYFTDIITFDYSTDNCLSGDIFISLEMVRSNASEFGVSFDEELLRILIHGILHLCGQEDKTPETKVEMTRKEDVALRLWKQMAFQSMPK